MQLSNAKARLPIVIEYFWPQSQKFWTFCVSISVPINNGDHNRPIQTEFSSFSIKKGRHKDPWYLRGTWYGCFCHEKQGSWRRKRRQATDTPDFLRTIPIDVVHQNQPLWAEYYTYWNKKWLYQVPGYHRWTGYRFLPYKAQVSGFWWKTKIISWLEIVWWMQF